MLILGLMPQEFNLASDEALMELYQNGESRAFDELFRRYSGKVYGYLRAKVSDPAFTDDIFQAVFFKLHRSRHRYDSSLPFKPWLFTVCRNVLLDELRKRNQDTRLLETMQNEPEPSEASASSADTDALPNLAALPERQRQAVEMRYHDELTFEEIATRLQTSPANVRQLISRAIRVLKGSSRNST